MSFGESARLEPSSSFDGLDLGSGMIKYYLRQSRVLCRPSDNGLGKRPNAHSMLGLESKRIGCILHRCGTVDRLSSKIKEKT